MPLHGATQLLLPLCGGLCRAGGAVDGSRQPEGALQVKKALFSALVLRTFDPARCAVLTTDASNFTVVAVLSQPDDEGMQHPLALLAYESRKMTAAERSMSWICWRCLLVLRHYLLGGGRLGW